MPRSVATTTEVGLDELLEFVRPRHHMVLLTQRRDGTPQASPVSGCVDPAGRIVVATYKAQLADREMYRFVGIEPEEQAILVNKSSVHFRADFEPIAETILVATAPGPMALDPGRSMSTFASFDQRVPNTPLAYQIVPTTMLDSVASSTAQ